MNLNVAVIGEGVIDRFVAADESRDVIGGSPLNTAVALKRAGVKATWWAKVSNSPEGNSIVEYATQNEVAGQGITRSNKPAPIVTISLNETGVPSYDFALAGAADWDWQDEEFAGLAGFDAVQIGSLTTVIEPGSSALMGAITKLRASSNHPLISFDPNARPKAAVDDEDANRMRSIISLLVDLSDLVKVSDEDLEWFNADVPAYETARVWSTRTPKLVVMTRGSEGAVAFANGAEIATVPGVKIKVEDTVGAGDTFMAWLLAQILQSGVPANDSEMKEILSKSAQAAAITCSRKGCNPPFATEV